MGSASTGDAFRAVVTNAFSLDGSALQAPQPEPVLAITDDPDRKGKKPAAQIRKRPAAVALLDASDEDADENEDADVEDDDQEEPHVAKRPASNVGPPLTVDNVTKQNEEIEK